MVYFLGCRCFNSFSWLRYCNRLWRIWRCWIRWLRRWSRWSRRVWWWSWSRSRWSRRIRWWSQRLRRWSRCWRLKLRRWSCSWRPIWGWCRWIWWRSSCKFFIYFHKVEFSFLSSSEISLLKKLFILHGDIFLLRNWTFFVKHILTGEKLNPWK